MLKFQPKDGSVVYCDYIGFVQPEMTKRRPVIVVSRHRQNPRLLVVVPISTTESIPIYDYHIKIEESFYSLHLGGEISWVKCDMINVVSLERLHLVKDRKTGLRYTPHVGADFLKKVKEGVKIFLRL